MDATQPMGTGRWLGRSVALAAGGVGLVAGYDFGMQLNGSMLLGAVLALNGAAFCTIIAAAAVERLGGRLR